MRISASGSTVGFVSMAIAVGWPSPAFAVEGSAAGSLLSSEQVGMIKFGVAAFTAGLLAWGAFLRSRERGEAGARRRDALLLVAGVIGALGWWNLLQFRYEPGFGHPLDIYHYYIGSKYFDELGYTRLYECTTVADARSGLRKEAASRSIRNLETYERESAVGILSDPERCTRHFTPQRWTTFVHDVGWFRKRIPEGGWRGLLSDYGYNPSPAWGAVAWFLMSKGPVSERNLAPVLLIDPFLLITLWVFVWKAFGWRATCVALVFWGTNLPGDYLWTGGGFLRQGWLASLVIGICCLRMRWMATGGFCLGVAALLRVFPVLAIAALALKAGLEMWRAGRLRIAPETRRFAVGCAASVAILVPLSLANAGGPRAWIEFTHNIRFHASIPFGTNIGLNRVLLHAFPPSPPEPIGAEATAAQPTDSSPSETYRRIARAMILVGYGLLLARAARRREDWEVAIVGSGAVVIAASMSCYYIGVLLGFGLLWLRYEGIGVALCGLAALTWCALWIRPEIGETYVWISALCVLFVLGATARCAFAPAEKEA